MEKAKTASKKTTFKLPTRLVSSVDLARVTRELKTLDDWLNQASIRSGGQQVAPPKTSATLEEISSTNGISLLDAGQRQQFINFLDGFMLSAPKIHISFAVEPSVNFLSQLVSWLRENINPVILLDVGLQPALTAGCSVRTTNKLFDMSLRNRFTDSRHFLVEAIDAIEKEQSSSAEEMTTNPPQGVTSPQPTAEASPQPQVEPASSEQQSTAPPKQPTTEPTSQEKVNG